MKVGDRVRFVRDLDGKCGPRLRIGTLVTVRALSDAGGFAVKVDDGDPENFDMNTNGQTFSEWLHVDCFEKETP